jgi:hypothetical protein
MLAYAGACGQGYEGGVVAVCSDGPWTYAGSCTGGLAGFAHILQGLRIVQLLHSYKSAVLRLTCR